jgi:hypothetical protein
MSRTHRPLDGAAAEARATLAEADATRFDRLAGTVLGSPGAVLGPALRAALPGTSGIRWLHAEGLAPTARASALTAAQWLSLFAAWSGTAGNPSSGGPVRGGGGRTTSAHGHAPGAKAAPRWF